MTESPRRRRWTSRPALALAIGLAAVAAGIGATTPVHAVGATDSSNRLDQPMADAAVLAPARPDGPPRLLVVDAIEVSTAVVTIRVLERSRAWDSVAESSVDLGIDALGAPWLIGLGPDRFALIVTLDTSGGSIVVGLRVVAEPGGRAVEETGRVVIRRPITDAAAADVDGDGTTELLLGPTPDSTESCPVGDLLVYDAVTLSPSRTIRIPDRLLGAGVVGPFDDVPGDELLVYADEACFDGTGPLVTARLIAIRLSDGLTIFDTPSGPRYGGEAVGPPLRVDLDGRLPAEVVAMTAEGLSLLDPAAGWASMPIATTRALALGVGAAADAAGPAVRVVWTEPIDGTVAAEHFRRGPDGTFEASGGVAFDPSADPERWLLTRQAALDAADRHEPALGWLGDAVDAGCPDAIVPGALLRCGADAFRTGPTWIGTRPILAMGAGPQRSLLVAAGLGWDPNGGLPPSPSPWAAAPAGWWRHGPSVPFALSEMRSSDTTYFREFPVPLASIEATAAPEISITLPGFTGTRLFVRARALADGAEIPGNGQTNLSVLGSVPEAGSIAAVVRVPVPPGVESGRDGSSATLDLSRAALTDGTVVQRWALDVVPLNDWGELGDVASGIVQRDQVGPSLRVTTPFANPVWPFEARLTGATEPGATVVVDGLGAIELDRRGRFAIETTLAPWPQTYRITATDRSGNITIEDLSVVGGIDYRQFPWLLIAAVALLALVTARGMLVDSGPGRRSRRPVRRSGLGFDEGPRPEIEELPPGGGLAPR